VGVPRELVPDDDLDPRVASVFAAALDQLRSAGFVVVDPLPMGPLEPFAWLGWYRRAAHDIDAFLRVRGGPDLATIAASGRVLSRYQPVLNELLAEACDPASDPDRPERLAQRARARATFVEAMDVHGLDALIFPTFRHPPVPNGDRTLPRSGPAFWAPHAALPALSIPMGWTPEGLPLGLQWMARPGDESRLLGAAEAFEAATDHQRAPTLHPDSAAAVP